MTVPRNEAGQALNRAHRQRFLFSGLLECGCCGGAYTIMGKERYGCANHRATGTCTNGATIVRQEIESRVLGGLKDKLMAPELVQTFIDEVRTQANQLQAAQQHDHARLRARLDLIERKIAAIVATIEDGHCNTSLITRLTALEREQGEVGEALREEPPEDMTLRLHPRLSDVYASKVRELERVLNDPSVKQEATELLRGLIERIELKPRNDTKGLDAYLYGDLARVLDFCEGVKQKQKLPGANVPGSQLSVVAGVGFEPTTFRL